MLEIKANYTNSFSIAVSKLTNQNSLAEILWVSTSRELHHSYRLFREAMKFRAVSICSHPVQIKCMRHWLLLRSRWYVWMEDNKKAQRFSVWNNLKLLWWGASCTSLSLSIFVPDKNVTWGVAMFRWGQCKTIRYKKSPSDWMGLFYIKAWQWPTFTWELPHYHRR